MNNFFKEKLKNRLMYCLNWKKDTELYLKYKNLTDTVNRKYYEKKPILKLFKEELRYDNVKLETRSYKWILISKYGDRALIQKMAT